MTLADLIPTFEVGERVLFHYRPAAEAAHCPHCGYVPGTKVAPYDEVVTILRNALSLCWCRSCGETYEIDPAGWWFVRGKKTSFRHAPYTLLEKIE